MATPQTKHRQHGRPRSRAKDLEQMIALIHAQFPLRSRRERLGILEIVNDDVEQAVAFLAYNHILWRLPLSHLPERWWPHTFDIRVSGLYCFPSTIWMKNRKLTSVF